MEAAEVRYTVTVALSGDLESEYGTSVDPDWNGFDADLEAAESRAEEIAASLRQLAEDLGLNYVSLIDLEVEPLD